VRIALLWTLEQLLGPASARMSAMRGRRPRAPWSRSWSALPSSLPPDRSPTVASCGGEHDSERAKRVQGVLISVLSGA